ncbi:NAD(P)/FAD-dependent oxidoreductase [Chloroflexota bacterium]
MVVVGGGPVGSYTAGRLAGLGYNVAVLERQRQVGERVCCTGIIGLECAQAFGIKSTVLREANSARLYSPSGDTLRVRRPETQALILDRAAFDKAMAKRAQSGGAGYLLGILVRDIKTEQDRVSIEVSRDGTVSYIEARVAVIASGFGLRLTEKLGLGRVGDFVAGAQVDVATAGVDEVEVYFGREIAPGFFAWLVPTSPGISRAGLLSRRDPGFYLKKLLASWRDAGKVISINSEISYGGIPLKPLPRTYGQRLLVVGDAAGQVKPTSGGGIYYGLLCADIAVATLHRALAEDNLTAANLAGYQREWRKKLGRELRTGYWARKLFERLSDRRIDRLFDMVKANGIDEALLRARDLSFDWHGRAVLKLLGHVAVSWAVNLVKIPFGR